MRAMLQMHPDQGLPGNIRHPSRPKWRSLWRGLRKTCPNCGTGKLFDGYLTVRDECAHCHEALHHQRADDGPPYFTIFIVGHILVPIILFVEMTYRPPLYVHLLAWLPLTVLLTWLILPMVKGAVVGFQWAMYMHGFDPDEDSEGDPGHIDMEIRSKTDPAASITK